MILFYALKLKLLTNKPQHKKYFSQLCYIRILFQTKNKNTAKPYCWYSFSGMAGSSSLLSGDLVLRLLQYLQCEVNTSGDNRRFSLRCLS